MSQPLMMESSSIPDNSDKPVIVRVKRKVFQCAVDAFWLEIHERPLKRQLLDFEKLSLSDASSSIVDELKTKKVLVQHVETITSSKDTVNVLRSFVQLNSSGELNSEEKNEERRQSLKTVNTHDKSLVKAKQRQEVLSRHARFAQIWRSRKGIREAPEDETIHDMCKLYDIVRVDDEEHTVDMQNDKDKELDDFKAMAEYLPLLREVLPTAAEEIESDFQNVYSKRDGYVYDFYAIKEDVHEMESDLTSLYPLVQVDDDDSFYDGPDDDDYQTDDSNAEDNPLNDYPDEELTEDEDEDEDEVTSQSSDDESDDESRMSESHSEELEIGSIASYDYEGLESDDWSDNP